MSKTEHSPQSEPEFEQRCNSFIQDLSIYVDGEYPTIDIAAFNLNRFFSEYSYKKEVTDTIELVGSAVNLLSSSQSLALVRISPQKGIEPNSLLEQVVTAVDQVAQKHSGFRSDENEELNLFEPPYFPEVYLGYQFLP